MWPNLKGKPIIISSSIAARMTSGSWWTVGSTKNLTARVIRYGNEFAGAAMRASWPSDSPVASVRLAGGVVS